MQFPDNKIAKQQNNNMAILLIASLIQSLQQYCATTVNYFLPDGILSPVGENGSGTALSIGGNDFR